MNHDELKLSWHETDTLNNGKRPDIEELDVIELIQELFVTSFQSDESVSSKDKARNKTAGPRHEPI